MLILDIDIYLVALLIYVCTYVLTNTFQLISLSQEQFLTHTRSVKMITKTFADENSIDVSSLNLPHISKILFQKLCLELRRIVRYPSENEIVFVTRPQLHEAKHEAQKAF